MTGMRLVFLRGRICILRRLATLSTGATVCDIVSKTSWISYVVHTSNLGYTHGIAGSYWHMAGSIWPLFLYAVIAVEAKSKFPGTSAPFLPATPPLHSSRIMVACVFVL